MLIENIVAQMLVAGGHKLFFYSRYDEKNADNRMEIDFLVQKPTITSRHNISPIEVKSSTRYTLTSINKYIKKYGNYLGTPYVLHSADLRVENGIVFLPLYMTPFLQLEIEWPSPVFYVKLGELSVKPEVSHGDIVSQALTHR